eukprot:1569782-Pleurochrysis_carterae.AAC.1
MEHTNPTSACGALELAAHNHTLSAPRPFMRASHGRSNWPGVRMPRGPAHRHERAGDRARHRARQGVGRGGWRESGDSDLSTPRCTQFRQSSSPIFRIRLCYARSLVIKSSI